MLHPARFPILDPDRKSVAPQTRIEMTDYRVYIDVLLEELNRDSVWKISMEDMFKIFVEQAMNKYCPNVVIYPNRKRFETWKF